MYNMDQISKGVSPQRVEEYKRKTEKVPGRLRLKMIVWLSMIASLATIFICYRIYG